MFKKIGFKPNGGQFELRLCYALSQDKIQNVNRPYRLKSSQRVVLCEIPVSSLIVRSYWLLGSPCCVTTIW